LSAASPSDTMSMTPEPRAQNTAASVPTGCEPGPPPAPKDRPRPRPTYKGKQKQMETLDEENVSPDATGSQGPEKTVDCSPRRASNKRDREKDAGTEAPAAKKKKATRTSPEKDVGQSSGASAALEIVEEAGIRPKRPMGRPRKYPRNAKDLLPVASPDRSGDAPSAERERPQPRSTLHKEVGAGGSVTEVLAGGDDGSNTVGASPATVDQEHTPRRHSARVAARHSGAAS
jgi:hypothetical protein